MKRAVLIPLALAFVLLAPASAALDRGTIVPGRGVGGVELGITRADVIAKLGRPSRTAGSELTWDLWRKGVLWIVRAGDAGGRVNKIQLAVGHLERYPFCIRSGACLGEVGGVGKLRAQYGSRLKQTKQLGYPAYLLAGKGYRGYNVYTVFVARPDAGPQGSVSRGRITNVAFGYCAASTLC